MLLNVSIFLAEAAPATPPQWWQVATGILAIPAAMIGLIYSWFLVQKTRLETKKLASEIATQAKKASAAPVSGQEIVLPTREAVIQATVPLLLLRYVLLHLLWSIWGYFSGVVSLGFQGIGFALYALIERVMGHDFVSRNEMW